MNKEKMMKIIVKLHFKMKVYPSSYQINKMAKRKTGSLNGTECQIRREIFDELGIKMKITTFNEPPEVLW